MKKVFLVITLIFITNSFAQQVDEIKVKHEQFGLKKSAKKMPKKIFIQHFFVNYQMLFDQIEIAKGGREIGGGHRGDAKAQLVLGVQGVSEEDLQEVTDKLYKEYTNRLKAKGFEILTAQEASKSERFAGWELVKGGTPSKAQFPGYVSTAPNGFDFLVRKTTKKGKRKSKKNIFDNGAGVSKDLGVTVARVHINVPFMKDGESQGSKALTKSFGGVAKVVGKPEFGILKQTTIMTKAFIGEKANFITTESNFVYKKSLKYQASIKTIPKKKILIKDVFEKKKYKAVKSASQDLWGTGYGAVRVFNASDVVKKKMQAIPVDADKYKNGVLTAGKGFLNESLNEFLKHF